MRLPLFAAATALTLATAACKNNDQHDNTINVDENLTAENIVSNDVTAIDAVTGDAANMAADVNYMDVGNDVGNDTGNETNAVAPSAPPHLKPNREATPPSKPTTNTAASATNNAAE